MKFSLKFKLKIIQKQKNQEYIPTMNGYLQKHWDNMIRKWEIIYNNLGKQVFGIISQN